MNICINSLKKYLNNYPKIKQWGWFFILWITGVMVAMSIAYPIKSLMKFL